MLRGSEVLKAFFDERPEWYPSLGRLLSKVPPNSVAQLGSSGPE